MRLWIALLIGTLTFSIPFANVYGQDSTKLEMPPSKPLPKAMPIGKLRITEETPSTSSQIETIFKKKEEEEEKTNIAGEPSLKWGEVSIEDLKMTTYALDTTENEILLLNYSEISRGFYEGNYGVFYDYHYRIKVMEKSKYSGGEIELTSDNYNQIVRIKAQTINYADGAIERVKVKEILNDDQGRGYILYRFSFPELKNGSVLEYKYRIFCSNPVLIESVYFQSVVPVVWGELRFFEMNELEYKIVPLGGKYEYFYEGKEKKEANSFHDGGTEYRWVMKNLPAVDYEDYISSIDNSLRRMAIQLHAYEFEEGKQYVFKDWDAFCERYYNDGDVMQQVDNPKNVKKLLKDIKKPLAVLKTDKEKMIYIFDYVEESMNWNGSYNIYATGDLKKAYEYRSGSSSDINFLVMAALRNSGIKAYPILISTREKGRLYKDYPLAKQFEHVIVQAEIGNEVYRFDATYDETPYNLMPYPNLNYDGLLIKNGKGEWIDMVAELATKTVQVEMEISEEGGMSGTFEYIRDAYRAFEVRQDVDELGIEKYTERYFSDFFPESKVTNLTFDNLEDDAKKLTEKMDFSAENVCQMSGDLMYFDLLMGLGFSESMFREQKRTQPVEITYPLVDSYTFKIKIPKGYEAEELPSDLDISLPDGAAKYTFTIEAKDGYLIYNAHLELIKVYYEVSEFSALRDFMDKVVEKQTSQVVMKKKG
jgi:hypothetical protein